MDFFIGLFGLAMIALALLILRELCALSSSKHTDTSTKQDTTPVTWTGQEWVNLRALKERIESGALTEDLPC